jgi:electron transfer flavoprotein beta subunit
MPEPLRIVVCVKHVPDAAGQRGFAADGTTDREAVDGRLSELDEYAVEQALRIAEAAGGHVTHLTMGPAQAADALRKALSMGGDAAVHVQDDALHGSDYLATSLVLAAALERTGYDLVVCGMASTDGAGSVVPAMLAERLRVPQATLVGELAVEDGQVRARRDGEVASEVVRTPLPAVVSVTDQTGEARYPSFKGIMAAKKKPVTTCSLADLGIEPSQVGLAAAATVVEEVVPRPARTAGTVVQDEGDGGRRIAAFLAEHKLA